MVPLAIHIVAFCIIAITAIFLVGLILSPFAWLLGHIGSRNEASRAKANETRGKQMQMAAEQRQLQIERERLLQIEMGLPASHQEYKRLLLRVHGKRSESNLPD